MRKMKIIKAIYFIWVFVNCYCLLDGFSARKGNIFFDKRTDIDWEKTAEEGEDVYYIYEMRPSDYFEIPFDRNENYDLTEFFVFVGAPALLYFLVGYVRK